MKKSLKPLVIALLLTVSVSLQGIAQNNANSTEKDTGTGANTVNANTITDPNGHQVPATENPKGNSAGTDLPSANNAGLGTENIEGKPVIHDQNRGNWGLLGLIGLLGLLNLNRQRTVKQEN